MIYLNSFLYRSWRDIIAFFVQTVYNNQRLVILKTIKTLKYILGGFYHGTDSE